MTPTHFSLKLSAQSITRLVSGATSLALLTLGSIGPANAQIIDLRATGTINSTGNYDSSVAVGGSITFNFEVNAANASVTYNSGGQTIYSFNSLASATSTESFGDYLYTQIDYSYANVLVNSGSPATYGYVLSSYGTDVAGSTFGSAVLQSISTPAVAPTNSLTSIQNFPLSDFNDGASILVQGDGGFADAVITSYSVTTVPEPVPLFLIALGLVGLMVLTRRRSQLERL